MVATAPYFDQVADRVAERLRGRVFVAHNVRFDWSFVSAALLEAVGEVPDVRRLCTLRMSRRLLSDLPRKSLDAVTSHYGIQVEDRHRARGDAIATAGRRCLADAWANRGTVVTPGRGLPILRRFGLRDAPGPPGSPSGSPTAVTLPDPHP